MFYVFCSVHNVFWLVLASILKLLLDVIFKGLGFTQAFLQEDFKLGKDKKHPGFGLHVLYMLLQLIPNLFFEEYGGKKNSVTALGLGYDKIVFVLLDS